MKVYLGGTCNESTWRNRMMLCLYDEGLKYFNPVVDDWDNTAQANELRERTICDFCLYTITPKMTGCYAIAEVIDDSNKRPEKTVFVLLRDDDDKLRFTEDQWRSLVSIAAGGHIFEDLKSAKYFNVTIEYGGIAHIKVVAVDALDAEEKAEESFDLFGADIEIGNLCAIEFKTT